jgi:hypothetical protein
VDSNSNRRLRPLKNSLRVLLLTVIGAPAASWALDAGYSLGYGLEYTDNALLTPDNKQAEWTNSAKAGLSLIHNSPALEARVVSDVEYRNYKNKTFGDETLFDLNLFGKWNISPQRFSWTIENFYTQTAINPTGPNTPNNRQNTNIVSTGPDASLRLNAVNRLELGARYARNTYETSDIDNTRTSGYTRWVYQSSPDTNLSLNLNAESVNYDDQAGGATNFTRTDEFVGLSNRFERNQFVLDAGTSRIHRENAEDVTGGLARLRWTRQTSSTSNIALYVSSQLSDAGQQALSQGQAASLGPLQPSSSIPVVTGDIFRQKSADVVYVVQRVYGSNTFRLFRQKVDFRISPADEDRRGGSFDVGHDFSEALSTSVIGAYTRVENFATVPSLIYRDKTLGIRIVNRFSLRLALGLDLRENRRDSDPSFGVNYTEHRGLLTLTYSDIRRVDTRQQ